MKQNVKSGSGPTNRFYGRLAAEKKKTVTALCLIALMVFMWARVLGKKTPATTEAAPRQKGVAPDTSESNSQLKISFIELPKVPGRNDALTRDFFAADGWQEFLGGVGSNKDVKGVEGDGSDEIGRWIAEELILEAIGMGENPKAFINDKLLAVGDKLLVTNGSDEHECEVVGIDDEMVLIRCGEIEITLKLTQMIEVAD
ncbi:MAG TPA: hypothetical protein VMY06_04370 [Sedimentisphaerales bacterium]|nr:hypothetical protein [Sedimentisphaerales bacterium]